MYGNISQVGVWDRELTVDDDTDLYKAGSGLNYSGW
jgi:hypothetical protein